MQTVTILPLTTSSTPLQKTTASPFDYSNVWRWLESKGKVLYGEKFRLSQDDQAVINPLICYFLRDSISAPLLNVDLNKGIFLTGPVGCGKTSLMSLLRFIVPREHGYVMKPCREVTFEFIRDGYEVIHRYSRRKVEKFTPQIFCFDDLGTENNIKYYGNECNVMAEVLLSRYDHFVTRHLLTHLTTNLSASEIEAAYGSRVRSRLRAMFNLISFDASSKDKRK